MLYTFQHIICIKVKYHDQYQKKGKLNEELYFEPFFQFMNEQNYDVNSLKMLNTNLILL